MFILCISFVINLYLILLININIHYDKLNFNRHKSNKASMCSGHGSCRSLGATFAVAV
jgi:hypothetical protein